MEITEEYAPPETAPVENTNNVSTVSRHRATLLDFLPSVSDPDVSEAIQWVLDASLSRVGRKAIRTPEEIAEIKERQKATNKRLREQRDAARAKTQSVLVRAIRHPQIGEQLREFNMPSVVDWFNPSNAYVNEDGTISVYFDSDGFVRPRAIETEYVNGVPFSALLIAHAEATAVVERVSRNRRWALVDVGEGELDELEFD